MKKYLFLITLLVTSLMATSCHEEDFGYTSDQIAYKTNFEKKYGKIKPDQTWDLTTYNLKKMGLVGGPSAMMKTRALTDTDLVPQSDRTVIVGFPNNGTIPGITHAATTGSSYPGLQYKGNLYNNWFKNQSSTGSDFVLEKPNVMFTIIPFHQASGIGKWSLHLVDMNNHFDYTVLNSTEMNCPFSINPQNISGDIYFYVKFEDGKTLSSKDGDMATYFCTDAKTTGVTKDKPTPNFILGTGGDGCNQLAFLIVVPQDDNTPITPDPEPIPDPDPVDPDPVDPDPVDPDPVVPDPPITIYKTEKIIKQYMIEDKGSTVDFDFNDIVVVVTQNKKTNLGDPSDVTITQSAKLKYRLGTIPFTLTIGDKQFAQMTATNVDEGHLPTQEEYGAIASAGGVIITGWNPDTNNIIVVVEDGTVENPIVTFPANGACPYMIAVDQNTTCPGEGNSVNQEWFETWVKEPNTEVVIE